MRPEERMDAFEDILRELEELSGDHTIVVEGPKDRRALNSLGIDRDTVMVQSEGGPLKVSEDLCARGRRAVILTDWDGKGEEIAQELRRLLCSMSVPFDLSLRERLKDICMKDIKDVESLGSLYGRLAAAPRGR